MNESSDRDPVQRDDLIDPASSRRGESREGLLLEYVQCNEFYNSRDVITGDLFTKLIQSFSTFAAILVALNIFGDVPTPVYLTITIGIGVFGLVSFVSIMLDMQGAASVKVAARLRAQEIEDQLAGEGGPRLWHEIADRHVFIEERLLKLSKLEGGDSGDPQPPGSMVAHRRERETEGVLFVFGARLAVLLWVVLVTITAIVPNPSA